jgi:hypothetical protein
LIDLGRKDEAMLELSVLNQSEGKPIPGGSAATKFTGGVWDIPLQSNL